MTEGGYHCHWGEFDGHEFPSREYGRRILGNAAKAKARVMSYYRRSKDLPDLGRDYAGEEEEDLELIGFHEDWEVRVIAEGEMLFSPTGRKRTPVPAVWQEAGLKLVGRSKPKASAPAPAQPEAEKPAAGPFTAKGHRARVGDAIEVLRGEETVKVRLHGIDCPEVKQPFWEAARDFAAKFVSGQEVRVEPRSKDRFGRMTAEVFVRDESLNAELVKQGLAWHDPKAAPGDETLIKLQRKARKKRRGLWAQEDPQAPW